MLEAQLKVVSLPHQRRAVGIRSWIYQRQ
jgi:hypothetical protein